MPKFTMPDGRWVRLRLPTVNEHLTILDLPTTDTNDAKAERLRFWRDTFVDATRESSWTVKEGDTERPANAGDLSIPEMFSLIQPWLRAAEDDAVPPASGSSSATPRREQRSQAPTASKRRSGGRGSSAP